MVGDSNSHNICKARVLEQMPKTTFPWFRVKSCFLVHLFSSNYNTIARTFEAIVKFYTVNPLLSPSLK